MRLVDTNLLLYACNLDAPQHEIVRSWWEEALTGDESVGLAWPVLNGFIRIATNARIFPAPLEVKDALAFVDRWLETRTASLVTEKPEHWRVFRSLLDEVGAAGNLTSDAHLAALAITHGATLASCDNDFGRFAELRWENPLRKRRG